MINKHIQKISARAFCASVIFFNTFHSKFTVFHEELLFETYTDMHIMINKVYNHTYKYIHVLIFLCLIGQGEMEISQGKVREFLNLV